MRRLHIYTRLWPSEPRTAWGRSLIKAWTFYIVSRAKDDSDNLRMSLTIIRRIHRRTHKYPGLCSLLHTMVRVEQDGSRLIHKTGRDWHPTMEIFPVDASRPALAFIVTPQLHFARRRIHGKIEIGNLA